MISSNPKLPQFGPGDSPEFVARSFWSLFQERFYTLWRELVTAMEKLVQGPATSTDNQVVRFNGTSGTLVQGSDVYITDDGRLYGTALHNNTGAVTGTTNQYVASGTYTPTFTDISNTDALTASQCQWLRVGNVVTVSGQVSVNVSDNTITTIFICSLPIASNFTAETNCSGVAHSGLNGGLGFRVFADTANDTARFSGDSPSNNAVSFSFTFTYLVL